MKACERGSLLELRVSRKDFTALISILPIHGDELLARLFLRWEEGRKLGFSYTLPDLARLSIKGHKLGALWLNPPVFRWNVYGNLFEHLQVGQAFSCSTSVPTTLMSTDSRINVNFMVPVDTMICHQNSKISESLKKFLPDESGPTVPKFFS